MKCTIESIRNIELKNNHVGSRIEGFVPMEDINSIPEHIKLWILDYPGVKAIMYADGIFIASWGETVCSSKDTYNALKGKHIAESKAKAKIYRFMKNFANYMANYYAQLSNCYQDDYLKYDHCVDHEEDHTDFLSYADQTRI